MPILITFENADNFLRVFTLNKQGLFEANDAIKQKYLNLFKMNPTSSTLMSSLSDDEDDGCPPGYMHVCENCSDEDDEECLCQCIREE